MEKKEVVKEGEYGTMQRFTRRVRRELICGPGARLGSVARDVCMSRIWE
jgi:hypothetical protein